MLKTLFITSLILVVSCSKTKDRADSLPADDAVMSSYSLVVDRVMQHFDDTGFAIVWGPDGLAKHHGDGLWRTGLALAAMPCDKGSRQLDALEAMTAELGGGFWRHPSIPDKISMDGALAIYLAAAARTTRCPSEADRWATIMTMHRDFMAGSDKRLNPHDSTAILPLGFDAVRDQVFHRLGLVGDPHSDRMLRLETEVWAWALAVRHSAYEVEEIIREDVPTYDTSHLPTDLKAACFRVNLGWMSLRAIEHTGRKISNFGRDRYCAATDGMGLALVDHWCGRPGLAEFNESWQPNVWDFKHQRCPAWEEADCVGDSCGGIDLLHGLTEQYDLL